MPTLIQFADAIHADDVSNASALLIEHPDLAAHLNQPLPGEPFGGLAIGVAMRKRSTAMLDLLIAAGADINGRSSWWAGGFGVLELCDPDFAPELIARGARVDACAAARLGDLAQLTMLLDADPSVIHLRCGDGKTPLHYASTVEIAQLLLDRGADIDALDIDHESTPAQYLVRDHPAVAHFLVTRGCRTDILLAGAVGAENPARRILDATPDAIKTRVSAEWFPMRDDRAGGTIYTWTLGSNKSAFILAREQSHVGVARLLAERMSPAQLFADLAYLGDEDGVKHLLARNPDVVLQLTDAERGMLSAAIFDGNTGAVRLMLDSGWPVNATNAQGATALHSAAWHGHAKLVQTLLAAGADVNAKERQFGATPLGWAEHGAQNSWLRGKGDYASVIEQLKRVMSS